MKKTKLILVISAFMLTAAIATAQTKWNIGTPIETDVTATFSGNTLTISGKGEMMDFTYESQPWASIRNNLKTLVIKDGVTTIGDYAFALCESLESITLPESLETIGELAFSSCLTGTLVIPEGVKTIKRGAFYLSGLSSIILPKGLESIESKVFDSCSRLSSIILPQGLETIGYMAFWSCGSLKSITLPESLKTIEAYAFYSCGLKSIILPESLKTIGYQAFSGCSGLSGTLTIPKNVTTIGLEVFRNCTGLSAIDVHSGNATFSSADGIVYDKEQTTVILCPEGKTGAIPLPKSIKTIRDEAFHNCTGLNSIILPESLTTIGDWAFRNCTGLKTVTNLAAKPQYITSTQFDKLTLSNITLYVPETSLEKYRAANGWGSFKVAAVTGIQNLPADEPAVVGYYSLSGMKLPQEPASGTYIIMYDNGKAVKAGRR